MEQIANLTALCPRRFESYSELFERGDTMKSLDNQLTEEKKIRNTLSMLLTEEAVEHWLNHYNRVLVAKPIDLIREGETDVIWKMIYEMRTGSHT